MTVANGEILQAQETCKNVMWESQGLVQTTEFLVLPLRGCDLVLGVHWLRTLGPIIWDFSALTMQFSLNDQLIILQGIQGGTIQLVSEKQLSKSPGIKNSSTLLLAEKLSLHLMTVNNQIVGDEVATIQLQTLLQRYAKLFDEPT